VNDVKGQERDIQPIAGAVKAQERFAHGSNPIRRHSYSDMADAGHDRDGQIGRLSFPKIPSGRFAR
jgi:hypothetical protein